MARGLVVRTKASLARAFGKKCNEDNLSNLLNLPPELFYHILGFLDAIDIASISLCNHALKHALTSTCWSSLDADDRETLLVRVTRDRPTRFYCYTCKRLHLVAHVGPQRQTRLKCVQEAHMYELPYHCFGTHNGGDLYQLSFQLAQLVMMRHRYGPAYGISLNSLAITELRLPTEARESPLISLLSIEPQIVDDRLYLRVQQWNVLDSDEFQRKSFPTDLGITICSHFSSIRTPRWWQLITCKLEHADLTPHSCPTCHPLLQCDNCYVDFRVITVDLPHGRRALVATKWLDMGMCETPRDPYWRKHLYEPLNRPRRVQAICPRGSSARVRFESAAKTPEHDLTEHFIAVLSDAVREASEKVQKGRRIWMRKQREEKRK